MAVGAVERGCVMPEETPAYKSVPQFNQAVCEALGVDPATTSRLVLVLDAEDEVPTVYIKKTVLLDAGDGLVRVLKMGGKAVEHQRVEDVQVDDNGNVFVVEKEKTDGTPTNP